MHKCIITLESALLCNHRHWGANLDPSDVTWIPKQGIPPYNISIEHIAQFFNINHSIIKEHPNNKKHNWTQSGIIQLTSDHSSTKNFECAF